MALIYYLYNFSYHTIVPMVLKAPEERYYGNIYNKTNKSAIGTTLLAVINRIYPLIVISQLEFACKKA